MSPPSSKCLHLFRGNCLRYLHSVHSILSTIFFVVLAWNRKYWDIWIIHVNKTIIGTPVVHRTVKPDKISIWNVFSCQQIQSKWMTCANQIFRKTWHKFKLSRYLTYLLSENGFCLTSISGLFSVVTSSTLTSFTFLGLFVLSYFVNLMDLTFFTECSPLFGYVNLEGANGFDEKMPSNASSPLNRWRSGIFRCSNPG